MGFECNRCKDMQTLALPDGKFFPPTSCLGDGCKSRSFSPIRSGDSTETIDYQRIRVQEIIESGLHGALVLGLLSVAPWNLSLY
jgi:DNA helicase MCM8